ncbi:fibronectin type III domain-containing protein [Flavobacterium hercynium]|uniref:Fibronectin type-III domain-containing protein n=1 Tax=Flavobacterium hercynium TaxID=387094 RepID=A0A226HIM1_9FLAO|nr:fibronectin type III domain-containing protein [Flavobacterium hercynium]OXA93954.1 hypothetical protein B0A66_05470 [Flavobacterium hercynium]SMP34698.1 hypothetical protein SAMN06265346_11876 [Flavobacterium hercynium]
MPKIRIILLLLFFTSLSYSQSEEAVEDVQNNPSDLSEDLVLEKTHEIPLAAPVFKNYSSTEGKVTLKWIQNDGEDIVGCKIVRREKGQPDWIEIKEVNESITEFTDDTVENRKVYQYGIMAKDKNDLSFLEDSALTVTVLDFAPLKAIGFLEGIPDRQKKKIILNWDYANNKDKVLGVSIYKNAKGSPPKLWRELDSDLRTTEDFKLKINTEYEYHFIANLESDNPVKEEILKVVY